MMGCICCKPCAIEDSKECPRERPSSKASWDVRVPRATSSRSKESNIAKDRHDNTMLSDKQVSDLVRLQGENLDRKREKMEYVVVQHPGIGSVPKATQGEQVAAGWHACLIGQGTYSNVYKACDLDQKKIVALKIVRFDNLEPESVRFMAREIHSLRRLDHQNIIKLEGLVTSRISCSLYLVFEYMEHDLAGLASHPGLKFSESQRDIKGSNLLIDNNGILKIADFGLASFFDPHQNQPLTSRVVTLWYRPPELLLGATNYGKAVDLWSTGCILAELYAGKPVMPGRTEVEQLHKIFKLCGFSSEEFWRKSKLPHATIFKPQRPYRRCVAETFKEFPAPALALMETLLSIDPDDRGSAASALRSEFFTTEPLPSDPSSLPKHPPSKELDAKIRDEGSRRQGAAGTEVPRPDIERRATRESRAVLAPDANAELKRQIQSDSKSQSEKFNLYPEEVTSGFPIDPPRPSQVIESNADAQGNHHKRASHPGVDLSMMSGLVAPRSSLTSDDSREKSSFPPSKASNLIARFPGSFKESSESGTEQDPKHNEQQKDGRNNNKDPVLVTRLRFKGSQNSLFRTIISPVGQHGPDALDHDRQIQEAVRRARLLLVKIIVGIGN
ncbi:putative serine/threonine-protein kinase [Hibiscus syriacus]|uniref:Serine/threonine-protein kinase n=1 Tax=Hibiscus syriacus TaxID=106335 RepID=A0A6A2Y2M3_HIBSY|nr:putative serine/threonine-protein kinase [Hibiscus syriacus]